MLTCFIFSLTFFPFFYFNLLYAILNATVGSSWNYSKFHYQEYFFYFSLKLSFVDRRYPHCKYYTLYIAKYLYVRKTKIKTTNSRHSVKLFNRIYGIVKNRHLLNHWSLPITASVPAFLIRLCLSHSEVKQNKLFSTKSQFSLKFRS